MIYLVISDAYIAPKVSQPGSGISSVCLVEAGLWVISVCVSPFGSESSIYKGAAVDAVMLWTRQKRGLSLWYPQTIFVSHVCVRKWKSEVDVFACSEWEDFAWRLHGFLLTASHSSRLSSSSVSLLHSWTWPTCSSSRSMIGPAHLHITDVEIHSQNWERKCEREKKKLN